MATIKFEDWSIEIKNVRRLNEYEWYDQIEYCDWSWRSDRHYYCCFTMKNRKRAYVKLFCGNVNERYDNLYPDWMWMIEIERKKKGESKSEKYHMIFMEPLDGLYISEDVINILYATPINKW